MMRLLSLVAMCAALLALPAQGQVRQDVLLIERVEVASEMRLPERGQLMAQVEAIFGSPVRKHATVGGSSAQQPPITRWDYAEFSVYFEHNHVVNAVVRKTSPLETGPKPVG
jgi:hypothetical protein